MNVHIYSPWNRETQKLCVQHYPCCAESSNSNKLISREKLCLICLKPIIFSNCFVGYLTVLPSHCIILKMGTCWCTAKIVEEAVCDLPFCVLWHRCSVWCSQGLTFGELQSPQKNWRAWCMPKLSLSLRFLNRIPLLWSSLTLGGYDCKFYLFSMKCSRMWKEWYVRCHKKYSNL